MNNSKLTIAGILSGTILEWYDFSLLGSLAAVISTLFFPPNSGVTSLLATFGVFATGFLARPLGGLIFGHFGDKLGRTSTLSLTIILMALPTTLIGLLPTYQTAGILAPIMLLTLRIMQGFATAGEYPGAMCLLSEMAPVNQRGFYTSLSMLGSVGGIFLGSMISSVFSSYLANDQLYSWGWRIPFILGAPLGIIGWFLRYKTHESIVFLTALKSKLPLKDLLASQSPIVAKIILLFALINVSFYLGYVYIVGYLVSAHKLSLQQGFLSNAISTIALALMIPIFGYLADKINRYHLLMLGTVGLGTLFYPIFYLFMSGHFISLLTGQLALALLIAISAGPLASIIAESFPTSTRYTGISVVINIGATVFGGTCPLVATYLTQISMNPMIPCLYPIFISFIFLCIYLKDNSAMIKVAD